MINKEENASKEQRVRDRYIELGGLIQNGHMVNKDKEGRARQNVIQRDRIIEQMMAAYDPRKDKGPSAYSGMADVEKWTNRDLDDGHFIEAYALTDQYIDTVIKLCFPEIFIDFYKKDGNRMNIETALYCVSGLGLVNKDFIEKYRDFKSTRDDLIHKSIFSQDKAKQLENQSKVKELPFKIIKEAENLFDNRCIPVFAYFVNNVSVSTKNNGEMLSDFIGMWTRIWKKRGKNPREFLDDVINLKSNEMAKLKK